MSNTISDAFSVLAGLEEPALMVVLDTARTAYQVQEAIKSANADTHTVTQKEGADDGKRDEGPYHQRRGEG